MSPGFVQDALPAASLPVRGSSPQKMTPTSRRRARCCCTGGGCKRVLVSSFGMRVRGAGNSCYAWPLSQQLKVLLLLCELLATVSASKFRTCEPYLDAAGIYHSGFHCPRLNDERKQTYCCRQSNQTLKYCCNRLEFQNMTRINQTVATRSSVNYGLMAAVLVYGLGVAALLLMDLLYYCSVNRDKLRPCRAPASLCGGYGDSPEGSFSTPGQRSSLGQRAS
ncbi:protein shisa-like-1 [Pristis pectinata]|uniref:protein shisa-like-1 n=1 Tax=Pristis pectinata TaxID=685728 RepID=UPI00223CBB9E|nr:protein shisa-like-1 [Pristis pectinata]